jgi:hypothetical protein
MQVIGKNAIQEHEPSRLRRFVVDLDRSDRIFKIKQITHHDVNFDVLSPSWSCVSIPILVNTGITHPNNGCLRASNASGETILHIPFVDPL